MRISIFSPLSTPVLLSLKTRARESILLHLADAEFGNVSKANVEIAKSLNMNKN